MVAEEVAQDELDPVAYLKALEKANGNEELARANYARHRIRRLKDLAAQYAIIQKVEAERQTQGQRLKLETAALKSAEKFLQSPNLWPGRLTNSILKVAKAPQKSLALYF